MHHIIYMSTAVNPMSDAELTELLRLARANNEQQRITGVLLYGNGSLMQVMEGEEKVLAELFEKIQADPRHTDIVKLADKAIARRSFTDWTMGFKALSAENLMQIAGYFDPENFDFEAYNIGEADALLLRMMQAFTVVQEPNEH